MTSGSVIISPGSFKILLTWVFSLFFFPCLLKSLFYWCFQRTSSLFHWLFSIVFLFSNSLVSTLYLLPSAWFEFILLFSRFMRWEVRSLIGGFFSFQVYTCIAIKFPLSTILASAQTKGKITQAELYLDSSIQHLFLRQWLKPWALLSAARFESWLHSLEVWDKFFHLSKPSFSHLYNRAYIVPTLGLNDEIHLKHTYSIFKM